MTRPAEPGTPPHSHGCGGCGAWVEYAADADVLRCPYCRYEQRLAEPARSVVEHPYGELATLSRKPVASVGAYTFGCAKCGASTESDALSESCQFCGAPLVVDTAAMDLVAPEAVLPFRIDRAGVRDALRDWISSRRFAPNRLKRVTEAESARGTYVPHWTFDCRTVTDYRGARGEHYWATEVYTTTVNGEIKTQTRRVRKTRWYPARGTVRRDFDDVLIAATGRLSDKQLGELTPWPLTEARPYQPDYLAGFQTLRYDIEPESGLETAKGRMAPDIRRDCRRDIGGDEQRVHSVDTRYSDITFKLMLLPVWIACYLYGGKTWQILVNGYTGSVVGQRPYSGWKIATAVTVVLLVITALALLVFTHSPR